MFVFSGARFLTSLGHHTLKCNRLHQRRIVSLGVTSLCQVIVKKQCILDTNVSPANTLSLCGVGSTTLTTLFSTQAKTTPEDGESGSSELGHKVFIGGYRFNHDGMYLKGLFSQFGLVRDVKILKTSYDVRTYGYAIVCFDKEDSVEKALLAERITVGDTVLQIKKQKENKYIFGVKGLPDDVNVRQVFDYFKSIADVELVNLVLNMPSSNDTYSIAYVVLNKNSDVILNQDHEIGNSRLTIRQIDRSKRIERGRRRKILLEGIPDNITQDDITSYFESMGEIRNTFLFTDRQTGKPNGTGMVEFTTQNDAHSAAENLFHEIGGSSIKVRALCYIEGEDLTV